MRWLAECIMFGRNCKNIRFADCRVIKLKMTGRAVRISPVWSVNETDTLRMPRPAAVVTLPPAETIAAVGASGVKFQHTKTGRTCADAIDADRITGIRFADDTDAAAAHAKSKDAASRQTGG